MKAHLFLLTACLSLTAADLGVIDPSHGILLNSNTTRPDFQSFQVELKPSDTTNTVTLTLKTNLLTVDDLVALPSGRIVMGLRSRFPEGLLSGLALYTFDLRRADPPVPSARRVALSGPPEPPKPLISEMERLRAPVPTPPIPFTILKETTIDSFATFEPPHNYFSTNIAGWRSTNITELMSRTNPITWNPADYTNQEPDTRVWTDVNIRFFQVEKSLRPIPNATNQSYAEYLDWLADRKGKRRNE